MSEDWIRPLDRGEKFVYIFPHACLIMKPGKGFRAIGTLTKHTCLREYGMLCENSKYFRDMVIQSFQNLGEILVTFAILFSGIWDTKGIWDTMNPLPWRALYNLVNMYILSMLRRHISNFQICARIFKD